MRTPMDPIFAAEVKSLHDSFLRLMAEPPRLRGTRWPRDEGARGVYLFSEGDHHLYVGRTNDVGNRYGGHHRPSASHNSAPFAFRLAREMTGNETPAYRVGESTRASLVLLDTFRAAFGEAKERIRQMDFRFVSEPVPIRQCLLEVYCAVVLGTPYNDFDNH